MRKMGKLKNVLKLQGVVIVYTLASIFAKLASGEPFFSVKFMLFTGMEFFILFLYAILWQQVIKKTELSVAYANREMYLLWSLLWAVVFFQNEITTTNIVGCVLVIAGTLLVTGEETAQQEESHV